MSIFDELKKSDRHFSNSCYAKLLKDAGESPNPEEVIKGVIRELCLNDLFFLLTYALRRKDANNDWCYARCREVESRPNGYLDLWAREHYKSTIITFALTIQDILKNPNITIGFFSHTRPIAKAFLRQIKREFEENKILLDVFPDVLWDNPKFEAPKWNEDEGIIVKRSSNPKESTIEAWGLVDGQPTSKHYELMIYDDIVTRESVTNSDMVKKTTDAWAESRNLTKSDGSGKTRYIGTRWDLFDTYRDMIRREAAIPRMYSEEDSDGNLVLWSRETQVAKRKEMGPYIYSCQIKQNPLAESNDGFKKEWLCYWSNRSCVGMNIYILVDPAGGKKKNNDYTTMLVIGVGSDRNYYLIDGIRDRLNLTEKGNHLFNFHKKYRLICPGIKVGYEKVGMQSDIEHYQSRMELDNYRFRIIPINALLAKEDQIKKLVPLFEYNQIYFPEKLIKRDYQGVSYDLVKVIIEEEYEWFPFCVHDDGLNCLSFITNRELGVSFPDEFVPMEADNTPSFLRKQDSSPDDYNPLTCGL